MNLVKAKVNNSKISNKSVKIKWPVVPPISNSSTLADIPRIKIFRNEVYGHRPSAQLDDTAFETLWQEITNPLVKLGILQQDIDKLKEASQHLCPEEESCEEKLKEWKELKVAFLKLDDDEVKGVRNEMSALPKGLGTVHLSKTKPLRHVTTRALYLKEFLRWMNYANSRAVIVTASLEFGKSLLSVKICELYHLYDHHFLDFKNFDSRNIHGILVYFASEMCENVDKFSHKHFDVLYCEHSRDFLSDAFQWREILKFSIKLGTSQLNIDELRVYARPSLENSFFCATFCDLHQQGVQRAAVYFFGIRYSSSRNPHRTLYSPTSQQSGNVDGFRQKRNEVLCREHFQGSRSDAFPVLSHDPFLALVRRETIVVIVDALDKEKIWTSFHFLELMSNEVAILPNWITIFISNTPDLQVRMKLKHLNRMEILFNGYHSRESLFDHDCVPFYNTLHIHPRYPMQIIFDVKPTNANKITSSEEDSDGQQHFKDKKDKKVKRKMFIDYNVPSIEKGKHKKKIRGQTRCFSGEKKVVIKHEKMSEERALKAKNALDFMKPQALMRCPKVKELEEENFSLKKQVESLQLKYEEIFHKLGAIMVEKIAKENEESKSEPNFFQIHQMVRELENENLSLKKEVKSLQLKNEEILVDLGQIVVETTAKENQEKKCEHFRQIFHSPSHEDKRSGTSHSRKDRSNNELYQKCSDPNSSSRPQVTNRSPNHPLLIGAEALVQERKNSYQPDNEKKVTNEKKERKFHEGNQESALIARVNGDQQTATTQNTPSIQSGELSSGEEEINKFRGNHDQASTSRNGHEDLSFSVQQHDSGRESISLSNIPPTSVATTLYNNYKFLLLSLAQNLLSSDVVMLQDWAAQNFSINNPRNATDILLQLDQKGVINASDLHQLSDFFESIVRFDLVYIIDAFLLGDYSMLRQIQFSKKRTVNLVENQGHGTLLRNSGFLTATSSGRFSTNTSRSLATSQKPRNTNGVPNSLPQPQVSRNVLDTANPRHLLTSLRNQSTTSTQPNLNKPVTGSDSVRMAEIKVANSPVTNQGRMTSNAGIRTNSSVLNLERNNPAANSNGSKHSKFQHLDRERSSNSHWDPDSDSNWLCSHYKRHCYVKFDCCDKFWPCHRCHNNQSTCGQKKLKSRDTRMLKCVYCNTEQQFGEHCCNCGAKFASYYCGLCKHLTGKDDHPYHCEKCGICRIHGDRSFHCDVCGVCLDVQLRGNHKCREGSAHDDCFICFEDAFTGCQILPCSHKVHKECATQMIRRGITRCPICRESFAHKLERRPLNSQKKTGK